MSLRPAVLVVDDDRAMRDMLVDQLREEGYAAETASGVDEALGRVRDRTFGAVVSDIRMRGKDGFALLQALHDVDRHLPVVLMTSFGDADTARRALADGAFAFLRKPFRAEELLEILDRVQSVQALG